MQEEIQQAGNLNVEIITPERQVFSSNTSMVVVPGIEGKFGVLPGHINFMSLIEEGIVEVFEQEGSTPKRIYVKSGFAEVTASKVIILVGHALLLGANPVAELNTIILELKTHQASTTNYTDIKEAEEKIKIAQKVIDFLNT